MCNKKEKNVVHFLFFVCYIVLGKFGQRLESDRLVIDFFQDQDKIEKLIADYDIEISHIDKVRGK